MRAVLRDKKLEETFQKDGYVTIPFLSSGEVEKLKQAFFDTLPESQGIITPADENFDTKQLITYDFTFIDKNIDYKRTVFKIITEAFQRHYDNYLLDYKPIIANYIRKKENDGEVPLHQNWAFVDEKKCSSVSIWCPLVDSTVENGTLQVVPGSHKRYGAVRGPMIKSELEEIKQEIIANHLIPLPTKAGDAVILDDSIVHYSAINKTGGLRLAIQLILIPEEEPSIHYHMDHSKSSTRVEVLEVDREFYMNFNPWKKPQGKFKKINEFDYAIFDLKHQDFADQLYGKRIDDIKLRKNLLSRILEKWHIAEK